MFDFSESTGEHIDGLGSEAPDQNPSQLVSWYEDAQWSRLDDPIGTGAQPEVIGPPIPDHDQTTEYTCAVVAQQMVLESFGITVSETDLAVTAVEHGWLSSAGGTSIEDMGKLLEHYGIETHTVTGAGVADLLYELTQGHAVIVPVDSGELWGEDGPLTEFMPGDGPDHAVVVQGIDMSDPTNPQVVINDPGDGSGGVGCLYPLKEFLAAWDDSGGHYVATDIGPADSYAVANQLIPPGPYGDDVFWTEWRSSHGFEAPHLDLPQSDAPEDAGQVDDRLVWGELAPTDLNQFLLDL